MLSVGEGDGDGEGGRVVELQLRSQEAFVGEGVGGVRECSHTPLEFRPESPLEVLLGFTLGSWGGSCPSPPPKSPTITIPFTITIT